MNHPSFIAGDWGTSHLRLMLCDLDGFCLESRQGPGAAAARGKFAETFEVLTADWRAQHGDLQTVLCGTVGANFGWAEAAYLPCPAKLDSLGRAVTVPRGARVNIVPGLSCTNPHGAPDVLRGEETQLLGALTLEPALARGPQLVCLPGTHTKWVWLDDGQVRNFLTAPTGELYGLLVDHSVLVRDRDTPVAHIDVEFKRGVADATSVAHASLLHRLFESRSRRLAKQLSPEGAASWTSGLLIAHDVAGALALAPTPGTITVIGSVQLATRYAQALKHLHRDAHIVDGGAASLAGLTAVHRQMVRVVL